jgi:hypothetical protein
VWLAPSNAGKTHVLGVIAAHLVARLHCVVLHLPDAASMSKIGSIVMNTLKRTGWDLESELFYSQGGQTLTFKKRTDANSSLSSAGAIHLVDGVDRMHRVLPMVRVIGVGRSSRSHITVIEAPLQLADDDMMPKPLKWSSDKQLVVDDGNVEEAPYVRIGPAASSDSDSIFYVSPTILTGSGWKNILKNPVAPRLTEIYPQPQDRKSLPAALPSYVPPSPPATPPLTPLSAPSPPTSPVSICSVSKKLVSSNSLRQQPQSPLTVCVSVT